jgi:molybdopterin-guanine dinucleotide biosynthesis protein A
MITSVGTWDAIVLAGGRSRRLGGIDKPSLLVGGRSLLDTALAACTGARVTVVVGPQRATVRDVRWTLESPPGSGPLAALAAGIAELGTADASGVVVVLAADLPSVDAHVVSRLLAAAEAGVDGAVVVDGTGQVQPLLAAYRRPALDRALRAVHDPRNRPVRGILDQLRLVEVVDAGAAADIDTPDDLARWADA